MNEDYSLIHSYNLLETRRSNSKDKVPPISMIQIEDKDAKSTKRLNMKKMIAKGKMSTKIAVDMSSLDVPKMKEESMTVVEDDADNAKFVTIVATDGYEAETEADGSDSDCEEVLEVAEDKQEDSGEMIKKMEDKDDGSDKEVMEDSEDESSDESDSSSDSDSSSESDSSDSDSSSGSESSSDSSDDSEDDDASEDEAEFVPDYYNGEPDYHYTYEWDDSEKQETGEDYVYTYQWTYIEENKL